MRISRICTLALFAALFAIAGRPATASAQFTVKRAEMVLAERNEAQLAAFSAAREDLNAVFTAQRAFFTEHGRYAATLDELAGVQVRPESRLAMTVGPDWYVLLAGDEQIGTMQHIVHRGDDVPAAALQAARADARGAALNPDNTVTAGG